MWYKNTTYTSSFLKISTQPYVDHELLGTTRITVLIKCLMNSAAFATTVLKVKTFNIIVTIIVISPSLTSFWNHWLIIGSVMILNTDTNQFKLYFGNEKANNIRNPFNSPAAVKGRSVNFYKAVILAKKIWLFSSFFFRSEIFSLLIL